MRFRSKSGIWIAGFGLTLLLAGAGRAKADLCNSDQDILITHQVYQGAPATIIRCPRMYSVSPPPRIRYTPIVKPQKAASGPIRHPARRVHHYRRQKGLLDALSSIFRPHR